MDIKAASNLLKAVGEKLLNGEILESAFYAQNIKDRLTELIEPLFKNEDAKLDPYSYHKPGMYKPIILDIAKTSSSYKIRFTVFM